MDSSVRGLMGALYHYWSGAGMANLWHACSKCHAGRFSSQPALMSHFSNYFCSTGVYILWGMCVCVCVCVCIQMTAYRLYLNYRCYQIVLQLKHFYTNWEGCEVLTGYLSLGRWPGGDWANAWRWTKRFTVYFQTGSSTSPIYFQIVFLVWFLEEAFSINIRIVLCIKFTT